VIFHVCDSAALDANGKCSTGGTLVGSATGVALTPKVGDATKATATSDAFTPQTAGHYCFRGDYVPAAGSLYAAASDFATTECFDVLQLQPSMDTAQRFVPNDSATVTVASGAGDLAGSVRFRLYDNATCTPSGTTLYDKSFNIVTDGTGTALSRTVSTDNTTAYLVSKSFSWLVEYTSTNSGHKNVTSVCNNEHSSITIANGSTSNTP